MFHAAICQGQLLKPATFKAQLDSKPLEGTNALYGEGIATGDGVRGRSGTFNGFSSDLHYFEKLNATLADNVNRLDRDNKSQSGNTSCCCENDDVAPLAEAKDENS